MDKSALKITADGSHTLYVEGLDETYHSVHGAIQEAKHVFIDAGLNFVEKKHIKILEIGYGTGLNTFLTLLEAHKKKVEVDYVGIEAFPLKAALIDELNYLEELKAGSEEKKLFHLLHQCDWENNQNITANFKLKKVQTDLINYITNENFDLIYFDAFGPRVQPALWEKLIFEKMYNALNDEGILVTYCAKGSVKRILKEVGFEVESLPGPPGKREMTRAIKC